MTAACQQAWPSLTSSSSPDRPPAGKSALALALAERRGGTVINADAMQTYDAFPILTAQPTAEERARVPHRALWRAAAQRDPVGCALARARRPPRSSAAGGRRHPVRWLWPLSARPDAGHFRHSRQCRRAARRRPTPTGRRWAPTPSARGWPSAIPTIVARLKPGDRQRHVRAWEVWQATGRPLSAWQKGEGSPRRGGSRPILLAPDRGWLRGAHRDAVRCHAAARRARRGAGGVRPPARSDAGPASRRMARRSSFAISAGELTLDEARQIAIDHTRQYAKRQMTWFRHQLTPDVVIDPSDPAWSG